MIIPSMIISHMQKYLSRFTSIFDVALVVSDESIIDVRTIQIETASANELSVGKFVISTAGLLENAITAVAAKGDNLEFTTAYPHDLINADDWNDDINLQMEGFTDSAYNTSFNIQTITAINKFQIINPNVGLPTLNGNELLLENRPLGVKGIFEVATIVSAKIFQVTIPTTYPDLPLTGVRDIAIIKGTRVGASATIERAHAQYTKQCNDEDAWMFLIMSDVDTSKDRHTLNDSEMTSGIQDQMRQRFLQHFILALFLPTQNELSGAEAQELAYGTVFIALMNTLFGASFFDENDSSEFLTVSKGHGPGIYNSAYYTHIYEWQVPVDATFDLGFQGKVFEDVAFRTIEGDLKPFDSDNPDGFEFNIDLF